MPVIGGQENDVGGVAAADAVVSVNVLNETRRDRHKRFGRVRSPSFAEGATNREAAARLLLSRHAFDFHLTHCLRVQAHAAPW